MAHTAHSSRRVRVTMSAKGQMVIPASLRAKLGLRSGTGVWVELDEDETSLRLRPEIETDPFEMQGAFAASDILRELEDDRRREIESDLRELESSKRA